MPPSGHQFENPCKMDIFNRNIHPNNLKVQNVAFGSFKISWGLSWYESKAAVERSSYVVSLTSLTSMTPMTSNDLNTKIITNTNSIEIEHLEPGEYQVLVARLKSQNSNQLSSGWSDPITVSLPSRDQLPPSIFGFNLTDLRFDRASIEWKYEENIDYYLNIIESSTGKLKNENVKISESPYRIHGLECLSKYKIQLYGKNKFGLGEIFETNFTTESNAPRTVLNHYLQRQ